MNIWKKPLLVQTLHLGLALALILGMLCITTPSAARDVPFPAKHTVDADFDGAFGAHAADVDGDGDLDILAAASADNDIAWWENTAGDGSAWTDRTVDGSFNGAFDVYAADVDGDGDIDILGASISDDGIAWWENTNGAGTAWTDRTVDGSFGGAIRVYAADVDGDGDMDVLGAANGADDIAWWENTDGAGTSWMTRTVDASFDGAYDVYAADVDGDGDLDVLGAASVADDIAWWENTNGDGSAWTEHTVDASFEGAGSVHAADVDGDGDLDVLGTANVAHDIAWWENTAGDGSAWTEHTVDGAFDGALSVYAADVDQDGDVDVLGAASGADDVTWWENTAGDGSTWTERTVDGDFDGANSVYAADVDGDGDLDVLSSTNVDDDVAWWENETIHRSAYYPAAGEVTVDTAFDGAYDVYAGDVDGDGDMDVLGAAFDADDVAWWENTAGDGSAWSEHTVATAFDGASSVQAADVDGDGDLDVLGAAWYLFANHVAWWENANGDGTSWTAHSVDGTFPGAISVYAADVDGDGDVDVLGAANTADDIAWWENTNGDGSAWTEHTVDGTFEGARDVYAADVDGDGDLDVLGAANTAHDITWWENTGDGSFSARHTVDAAFDGANSVYAADVDGDGDQDVLGAAYDADDIAWWENRGGQFALATADTAPAYMKTSAIDDVLAIEVTHRGRSGDSDLELVTLELLFEGCYGPGCTPANLTSAQANELFDVLRVYKDTGSGVFESGTDTLVANVTSPALTDGVQTITFSDGDANVQVAHGTPQTYFVVVDRVESAPTTPTVDRFTITHITEASSTAEDRSHDIGLTLQYAANTTSSQVVAAYLQPVNSPNDPGDGACDVSECTLREAIDTAASGDTITFDPALAGVTITLGCYIILDKDLTIDGSSLSSHVKINGDGSVRVFKVPEGVTVAIDHLDIRNGYAVGDIGGGIDIFSSTVTISNTTFSGNSADDGGAINNNNATLHVIDSSFVDNNAAVFGGAINNYYGTVTIVGSTISGNTAPTGGGLFNNTGCVTVTNSTVSGNSGTAYAGGLFSYGDAGYEGIMWVRNSTISGNTSPAGGGLVNGANSTLYMWNSIVANSPSGGDCLNDGTIATNINNLIEDGTCSPAVTGDPLLGPLADNGGPTLTMALGDGSPAIDAGDNATCQATDQRGIARPIDGDVDGTAVCDIGAYEDEPYAVYLPLVLR
jgi:CSLREA domain-containing protein